MRVSEIASDIGGYQGERWAKWKASNENAKKRGKRSPDRAEALVHFVPAGGM
jgi:hypothetical protein